MVEDSQLENPDAEPFNHFDYEGRPALELRVSEAYFPFFDSQARDLVSFGGAGAGKSFCAAQKIILKCVGYPKRKILVIRKHGPSLRLTCYSILKELLSNYKIPHESQDTRMEIKFPNGSQIICIPIADTSGESADRIKSLTDITDMWFEEPTELTFDEYQMVRLRLRGRTLKEGYRQRIYTFNPIDKNHWLHKFFFEPDETGKLRESERLKFTYKDNPYVDKEYVQELEELKTIDPVTYAVYALGEWGTLSNQIFTKYTIEEFNNPMSWYNEVVSGADFGYVHPSAWLLIGAKETDIYIIDEICKSKLINSEFIKQIQSKLSVLQQRGVEIFCDYAEPARIEEMRREGLNVREANKNVVEGLNIVKKYKLHIHPRCVETIKQIAGYRRKEDRSGNAQEKPVKFNDDTMDALRYAAYGLSENQISDYSTPVVWQENHIPSFEVKDILRNDEVPQF